MVEGFIQSIKSLGRSKEPNVVERDHFCSAGSGEHRWHVSSNTKPTYCNVCRDVLSGITWHGFTCEVCKLKVHKRCVNQVLLRCKWTTLDRVGTAAIYDEKGCVVMPHQWVEGNLPVSAKCRVCDRACGSVLRLQDFRCLWCNTVIHAACRDAYPRRCPLGQYRISILPPVAVNNLRSDGSAQLSNNRSPPASPLLVLINSKSGDNQGERFLKRFRQMLNPAQVYDLMNGGPEFGLRFFSMFSSFRVLIGGGDGSVGWVLGLLDKLDLHSKCQIGLLPLGTGNDLARVLGWGNILDDYTQMATMLTKFERAQTKMLDRWSVIMYEGPTPYASNSTQKEKSISSYEDSVACHLSKILSSDDDTVVISSAKVLCETVKNFVAKVGEANSSSAEDEREGTSEQSISGKCEVLQQKLDSLLKTLHEESEQVEQRRKEKQFEQRSSFDSCSSPETGNDTVPELSRATRPRMRSRNASFAQREQLMCRANSLKKAIRQIIEHAERAVDEQHEQTVQNQRRQHRLKKAAARIMRRRQSSTEKSSRSNSPFDRTTDISPSPPPPPTKNHHPALGYLKGDSSFASADTTTNPESSPPPNTCHHRQFHYPLVSVQKEDSFVSTSIDRSLPDLVNELSAKLSCHQSEGQNGESFLCAASTSGHRTLEPTPSSDLDPGSGASGGLSGSRYNLSSLAIPMSLVRGNSSLGLTVGLKVEPPTPCYNTPSPSMSNIPMAVANCTLGAAAMPVLGGLAPGHKENFLSTLSIARSRHASVSDVEEELAFDRSQCTSRLSEQQLDFRRGSYDIRYSASDSFLKGLGQTSSSLLASATRNISKISTKGNVDRAPSPQGKFMPAFRRGLIASGLCGGSLIAEVLLLNADVLGVAASPLMDFEDVAIEKYNEKRVMNNYFGIGLDAKISLEFHNKREGSSTKARSRGKLFMWYGMLGTKELLQRTYKNLEQKVHLECDGHRIQLPSLQGIVVLNIPSYAGGTNFWGCSQDDGVFTAQSYDDKILEVVAVFGVIHCATSRVISLQNHRIAQCRHVKIIITGDEPIPVQVDGEAWMQPPGYIQIHHKQRAQVLVRNRHFESTLKMWTERQRAENKPPEGLLKFFDQSECNTVLNFLDSADHFLACVQKASVKFSQLDRLLCEDLDNLTCLMHRIYPPKKLSATPYLHLTLIKLLHLCRSVYSSVRDFCKDRQQQPAPAADATVPEDQTLESLETLLISFCDDLQEYEKLMSFSQSMTSLSSFEAGTRSPPHGRVRLPMSRSVESNRSKDPTRWSKWFRSMSTSKAKPSSTVHQWTTSDVSAWLTKIEMSQYKEQFEGHDIRGAELLRLERNDLKELGVHKVGHLKRLEQAIHKLALRSGKNGAESSVTSI